MEKKSNPGNGKPKECKNAHFWEMQEEEGLENLPASANLLVCAQ